MEIYFPAGGGPLSQIPQLDSHTCTVSSLVVNQTGSIFREERLKAFKLHWN